jgi:uncharacterized phage protein gp47/JayE
MADQPKVKSREQILGEMLATFLSKTGINDLNVGSVNTSFFETMAQAIYRASGDTLSILRDFSVDRATGEALKRIATEERIYPKSARVATGKVTIIDTSFEKISTKIYAGANSPNVGSSMILVSDASLFTPAGAIYIGRGTPNVEGPISYSSITPVGGYYQINLSTPTTKFHNISESVVLSQGGLRNISVGTSVRAPATGDTDDIVFSVTSAAVILDGENQISNVPVAAQQPGTEGNVPRGAIREFVSPPFTGASVINESPFSTGRNEETDEELRDRIKRSRISKGLGTSIAIKNAVLGAQATDESAVVSSDEIFSFGSDNTVLYVDDGTGYEEKSSGVGLEFIIDSALGGEQYFQLATGGRQTSISKATLESIQDGPFDIIPTDRLAILVGGVLSEHIFNSGDFRSEGFATAYEVAASINSNSSLTFSASTSSNGKRVTIQAKTESNEELLITSPTTGRNAGIALYFPSNEIQTLRLYKNNKPLSKNGQSAIIESRNQSDWSSTIGSGDTLIISVDNTASITYSFTDADFLAEGNYISVNKNNSLQSWINVINKKVTGVTASIDGNKIKIISNKGANSTAALSIDVLSTLVSKGMFSVSTGLVSSGKAADFIVSRNTAQIKLTSPLEAGDSLAAGSEFTKGYIYSSPILGGNLTLTSDAYLWLLIDNADAEIISTGVVGDTLVDVSKPFANIVRYTSNSPSAFANVQVGDTVIVWSNELSLGNRLEAKVYAKTNTTLDIKVTSAEYAAAVVESAIVFKEGFVVIRTDKAVQKIKIASGAYNINTIVSIINLQLIGATSSVIGDEIINITTDSEDIYGCVLLVAQNDAGKGLNFTLASFAKTEFSQFAFYEAKNADSYFPAFVHSKITDDNFADVPNSFITSFNSAVVLASENIDPNFMVCPVNPFSPVADNISDNECVQIKNLSSNTVNINQSPLIRRLRIDDRFYAALPFDFGYNDSVVVILDADATNKTFPIPLYRKAIVNNTMPVSANNFRAYDSDSGPTTQFSQFFGSSYSFDNYKVLMQAKNAINPASNTINEDSILFRSARWGKDGERINVGYSYPTSSNLGISHTIIVDSMINIKISLKSNGIIPNTIDGTTEWDVTVTPNTPVAGVDSVTYSWNSIGTDPAMTTLSPDHYVTINSLGDFSPENIGTFRVDSATSTSFTVLRPNGVAVNESAIATLTTNTISLYQNNSTTAQEIVSYVNSNLSDYISASILDDNGVSGAGIINKSTYEDTNFANEGVDLFDGINWILSTNLSALSPSQQFSFKKSLTIPSINTATSGAYNFTDGEELRLIPTTSKQISELISTLAVSGFTTLGSVSSSNRESQLQISSQILGSNGAVQVTGGTANSVSAQVIGQSSKVSGTDYINVSVLRSQASGLHVDQMVKLSAFYSQKKETGISETTGVTILNNQPTLGQAIVELSNREAQDNYFGIPKNCFRDRSRAFHVEKQGALVCVSWDESTGGNPIFNKLVEINDGGGGSLSVDFDANLGVTYYTVASGNIRFFEVNKGDKLTISVLADAQNNGTFNILGVSEDGLTIATDNTSGLDALPSAIAPNDIAINTEVQEGDTVSISSPFSILNQGNFRVIRKYQNSFYIDNPSAVEERVIISDNLQSLNFDATTQFDVSISDGSMKISWNGVGTEPSLNNAKLGNILRVGSAFTANNQGDFMVVRSEGNQYQKFEINCSDAVSITSGQYFTLDLPNGGTSYYAWFNKDGSGGNPFPIGKTDISGGSGIVISTGDSSSIVANAVQAVIDAVVGFTSTVSGNIVTTICDNAGPTINAANVDVGGSFSIVIKKQGDYQFIECANAKAFAQSGIMVSGVGLDVLESHIPSLIFREYEAAIAGDKFVVSGSVLGSNNISDYTIYEVLSKNKIVVSSNMDEVESLVLNSDYIQVYVEEQNPYIGYKKIYSMLVDPSNSNRMNLIFDTNNQRLKINDVGEVTISAIGKLSFSEVVKKGLDSYRYNTGLIAEANRIVYGDPRDNVTYSGVAAAGAEIFIKPPLPRRITVSISVRVNTGVPFNKISEQVRSNIASLVNSSPIGQSIAISDIVATVNSIPGVFAVAISSPTYDVLNDVIVVNPAEKPIIIDIVNDITVSKVG